MNTAGGLSETHIDTGLCMILSNFKHAVTATENNVILVMVLNSGRSRT
jgi:hypothetical protein